VLTEGNERGNLRRVFSGEWEGGEPEGAGSKSVESKLPTNTGASGRITPATSTSTLVLGSPPSLEERLGNVGVCCP